MNINKTNGEHGTTRVTANCCELVNLVSHADNSPKCKLGALGRCWCLHSYHGSFGPGRVWAQLVSKLTSVDISLTYFNVISLR